MTTRTRTTPAAAALALAVLCACDQGVSSDAISPSTHTFFPVASGDHAFDCAGCHTSATTFAEFTCVGCHVHDQTPTDLVHGSVSDYAYASASCLECHRAPVREAFDHAGITGSCALCHDVGASFAALPRAGFTHAATRGADCGDCHDTKDWARAGAPGVLVDDPARDVPLTGLVPSWVGTTIAGLSARPQVLPMAMDHFASVLDAATRGDCAGCHAGFASGSPYPGVLHASLAAKGVAQPTLCAACHAVALPVGFVGPTATQPTRSPPSGEMKHDAVAWSGGAPTATRIVTQDCGVCHASPSGTLQATWATARSGTGPPKYHAALTSAQFPQPATCLDCHANARPGGVLTSATATLPAKVTFDHAQASGECATCHQVTGAGLTSWAGGRHHLASGAAPASCLPCHVGERPTGTAGWQSPTYATSPFDYGTNAAAITHGDGLDCVACHAGPGTGAWGSNQNWVGGHFGHGPGAAVPTTCIACHMSQRPDLQPGASPAAVATLLGIDHARDGTGDCFGCHQATVTAGRYVNYLNPATRALPGGDWKGGAFYPGATLVADPNSVVTVAEINLVRSGTLVTGMTTTTVALYGGMSHVSAAIPAVMSPGPAANPDSTSCWHCHIQVNGVVTAFAGGVFHQALTTYRPAPGAAVQAQPQPTAHCADCHAPMWPGGIVELAGSSLQPMDHSATFTAPVTLGGVTVNGVSGLDCSTCHRRPGDTFADGVFHANIGNAVPKDCTYCHYPLMATATADVLFGTHYAMSHRAPVITVQRCDACHTTALAQSTQAPFLATLWRTGGYHAQVSAQPSTCVACHAVSKPAGTTQGTVVYALPAGGTASNGAQWMSHTVSAAAGVDCAICHAADARAAGAAWSKSAPFHASARVPGTCQACHGLTNGNGAVPGTGNNLPVGLTNSTTLTTASAATGVPAGTHAQIIHTDLNVTSHDCGFCHTQLGPSAAAGVQGKEWAQARFHGSFSVGAPLVTNGTTGRCSNCHMNVKPGPAFTGQDHSAFTAAPGTRDCAECHGWPGTGTATAPNWLGAGAPQFITVGGFSIPNPPSNPTRIQSGLANLPHPSVTTCASCHPGGVGGRGAIGYDHASTVAATGCNTCHEAGSDLVGTRWNGATTRTAGAGDTRPFTLPNDGKDPSRSAAKHFFVDNTGAQVDCYHCHRAPTGVATATTGATYLSAWAFRHPPESPSNLPFCLLCHPRGPP